MGTATKRHQALLRLDERQLAALDVLGAGGTHAAAAAAAGVDRVTVTRWNTRHPGFIAERTARKRDAAREQNERLRSMIARAIDVVSERLDGGDLRAALAVLRLAGRDLNAHEDEDYTSPEEVYDSLIEAEARARQHLPLDDLLADLSGERDALERARVEAEKALLATVT
jgi:hypothetical protein